MSVRKRQENNVVNTNNKRKHIKEHKYDIEDPLLASQNDILSKHEVPSDLRGDRCNIAILFFLYLLQGIPLGLTAAIPMLLQNRGASYKQQVGFFF
jgi:hypothetical protein